MRFNRVLSAGALLALAVTAQHAVASAESITPQTPASASDTVAPNPINEKSHASARKSHAARKSGSKTKPTLAARRKLLMERFETLNGVVGSGESPATREKRIMTIEHIRLRRLV
jgi:hypothetical protein